LEYKNKLKNIEVPRASTGAKLIVWLPIPILLILSTKSS
jgi:hypothetical protein